MQDPQLPPTAPVQAIDAIVRAEWGRLLSLLIATLNDIQLAEDSLQDAVESALRHWPRHDLPRSPVGWLLQTARRKAIDRIRRARNFVSKQTEYAILLELDADASSDLDEHLIPDERLRLIFICCHPALEEKTRVAMTLRALGGLTTAEIANAFLDKEETMAQRLARAKRKIRLAGIPFRIPDAPEWPERLKTVLTVLYLIFNEGYAASSGDTLIRRTLCDEAIRLTRALLGLLPREPEIIGLLALMLLHNSRRDSRQSPDGVFVAMEEQDRTLWNPEMIEEGLALVEKSLSMGSAGPFQLQAAISAIHAEAKSFDQTNWREIVAIYDLLLRMQPSPVIRLNRAAALSYALSPDIALAELHNLETALADYQPFHATVADCLRRSGQNAEAAAAYRRAIRKTEQPASRAFLQKRLREIE
ncbi:MAG: RNA polymerase sigma factor [Beijerinckiaceae bacterium]